MIYRFSLFDFVEISLFVWKSTIITLINYLCITLQHCPILNRNVKWFNISKKKTTQFTRSMTIHFIITFDLLDCNANHKTQNWKIENIIGFCGKKALRRMYLMGIMQYPWAVKLRSMVFFFFQNGNNNNNAVSFASINRIHINGMNWWLHFHTHKIFYSHNTFDLHSFPGMLAMLNAVLQLYNINNPSTTTFAIQTFFSAAYNKFWSTMHIKCSININICLFEILEADSSVLSGMYAHCTLHTVHLLI